jgi:hypothetical protein
MDEIYGQRALSDTGNEPEYMIFSGFGDFKSPFSISIQGVAQENS